jgi:hypothetical protein
VRSWPLQALTRLRDSEARSASFDARRALSRARKIEASAVELADRAALLRREARGGGGGANLEEIARSSAGRVRAYRHSRVLVAESGRTVTQAGAARAQAGRAIALAAAALGRADALERGAARFMAAVRAARESVREMEAEESWNATRSSGGRK